jgi:putative ABC transport system permease protein
MIFQNLKQISRSLWRYKSFTLINIAGLSTGIAAILIIFLIADYEKSFDTFHTSDDIYRVVSEKPGVGKEQYQSVVPYTAARLLRNELPGIQATQVHYVKEMNVKLGINPPVNEKNIVFADSLFFNVLDYGKIKNFWIRGNASVLNQPRRAIVTQRTAQKYFGDEDPIGKLIKLDNKTDVEIGAVIKDIPATTHLPCNLFVSFSTFSKEFMGGLDIDQWGVRSHGYCYVRLKDAAAVNQTEHALHAIVVRNAEDDVDKKEKLFLQKLNAIHFDPRYENSNPSYTVSSRYLNMLLILGLFIIMIACINYINLSTSLAFSKSKEVGIRKTIGASRVQLFYFYFSETFVITALAAVTGVCLAAAFFPAINRLLDKSISLTQLVNLKYMLSGVGFLCLLSMLSGAYPAFILSGFNPITSLKNQITLPGKFTTLFKRGLVVFQFTTSIALIICTIIIARQMQFFSKKSLGFNKEAVIEVSLPVTDSSKREQFRNLLRNQAAIKDLSFCLGAPISDNGFTTSMHAAGLSDKNDYSVKVFPCDINYLETYQIKLIAGRWFFPSEQKLKDSANSVVVNETLVRTLGYTNPADAIGKKIDMGINGLQLPIIGVTQDFHTTSFHKSIPAVGLIPFPFFYYAAGIRIDPAALKPTLAGIESAWKKVYPDYVYNFHFIDETLAKRYAQETKDYNLFKAFSIISVFICCIGLWGLISFVVARKTKEIGIRKVLGANITGIVILLSKDFLHLIFIALIIASAIAWFAMNKWLQDFAYRVNISWWVFVVAGLLALIIGFLTVSFQAIKAALANPVKSLRSE